MTSLIDFEDLLNPSNYFMARWISGFVKVDYTVFKMFVYWTLCWGMSCVDWSEMMGTNLEFVVVLYVDICEWKGLLLKEVASRRNRFWLLCFRVELRRMWWMFF